MLHWDENASKKSVSLAFQFHRIVAFIVELQIDQISRHHLSVLIAKSVSIIKILTVFDEGLLLVVLLLESVILRSSSN